MFFISITRNRNEINTLTNIKSITEKFC